jgi:hypothetical protein
MSMPPFEHDELVSRIGPDLVDGHDEELELRDWVVATGQKVLISMRSNFGTER